MIFLYFLFTFLIKAQDSTNHVQNDENVVQKFNIKLYLCVVILERFPNIKQEQKQRFFDRFDQQSKDNDKKKQMEQQLELHLFINCQKRMNDYSDEKLFSILKDLYKQQSDDNYLKYFFLNQDEQKEVIIPTGKFNTQEEYQNIIQFYELGVVSQQEKN